jgi:hypothetical protein
MIDYEEFTVAKQPYGWAMVIGLCLITIAIGYVQYLFIPDTPRQWDYGALPDAPGKSVYSSERPPAAAPAPPQLPPFPASQPSVATRPGGPP